MHAYCLFCQTQKCKSVARTLEIRGVPRAFSPQIIKRQRVKGKNVDRMYDLLPGYVFVYSEEALADFSVFRGLDGMIRRLGVPEEGYELTGGDREFAMRLYRKNGVIGQITVFKVGDAVRLDDPLFAGSDGRITRIDLRKQRARVEYRFAGMSCYTWIACDMISAVGAPEEENPMAGGSETEENAPGD